MCEWLEHDCRWKNWVTLELQKMIWREYI
uniref:Uncharacterized protein n=1 Tax=Anguilla anguilla TaxID=7936 RepID=A0A0E9RFT6_ANGAN